MSPSSENSEQSADRSVYSLLSKDHLFLRAAQRHGRIWARTKHRRTVLLDRTWETWNSGLGNQRPASERDFLQRKRDLLAVRSRVIQLQHTGQRVRILVEDSFLSQAGRSLPEFGLALRQNNGRSQGDPHPNNGVEEVEETQLISLWGIAVHKEQRFRITYSAYACAIPTTKRFICQMP